MIRKLLQLLPKGHKKKMIPVACSLLASTVLSLFGIAVIMPIFILLLGGGDTTMYPFVERWRGAVQLTDPRVFTLIVAAGTLVLLVVKYLLSRLLLRYQTRYIMSMYSYFSEKLFATYYEKGYLFIKDTGTTDITYKINAVCYAAATMVLQPLLSVLAETAVFVITFAAVVSLSPFAALAVVVSFIPMGVYYFFSFSGRVTRYGRLENAARNKQYRIVHETFNGYPSIAINQAFPKMHGRFSQGLKEISGWRTKTALMHQFPPFLMELTVIACLALLMLWVGTNSRSLDLSLALFAACAMRLLPSIRSIFQSYFQIKNNTYAAEIIMEGLEHEDSAQDALAIMERTQPMPFNECVRIEHLTFAFPDRGNVLKDLSFTIQKGERVGVRGPSGTGKSTLFNILLGLYAPQQGAVYIDDTQLTKENALAWQKQIGYVPQEVTILNASIAENIAFAYPFSYTADIPLTLKERLLDKSQDYAHFEIPPQIKEKIDRCLEQAQLADFVNSLPHGIYTLIGENGCKVSGGQKQRIGIARALFKDPQVLFFDEATSSLDPQMEREVNQAISNLAASHRELTLIIIAHRPNSLELCDKIIDLNP